MLKQFFSGGSISRILIQTNFNELSEGCERKVEFTVQTIEPMENVNIKCNLISGTFSEISSKMRWIVFRNEEKDSHWMQLRIRRFAWMGKKVFTKSQSLHGICPKMSCHSPTPSAIKNALLENLFPCYEKVSKTSFPTKSNCKPFANSIAVIPNDQMSALES